MATKFDYWKLLKTKGVGKHGKVQKGERSGLQDSPPLRCDKGVRKPLQRKELRVFLSCIGVWNLLQKKRLDEYAAFRGSFPSKFGVKRARRWPFIVVLRAGKYAPNGQRLYNTELRFL